MTKIDRWNRALVTGASSGIGLEFAKQLAEAGTDLVIVARSEDKLNELAEDLDCDVEVIAADLSVKFEVDRVAERLEASERPIDLLINNAGFGSFENVVDLDVDTETSMIELNIIALQRLSNVAASVFAERGYGSILNVSSVASFAPFPSGATYAATKAFVTSFSDALHDEVKNSGVSVSCLCPGLTRTNFQEVADYNPDVPNFVWQTAEEVAKAGLEGLAKGKSIVVPGAQNKAVRGFTKVSPTKMIKVARKLFE